MLYPDKEKQKQGKPIEEEDSLANLVAAIAGGIEAPIQFILQVRRHCTNFYMRHRIFEHYFYLG